MEKYFLLTSFLFLIAHYPALPDETEAVAYGQGSEICQLDGKIVGESSGVAPGIANQDFFWTHNDSGGGPVIYAFDSKGVILGAYEVRDAGAQDWEDIASVRIKNKGFLVIADTGDNFSKRNECLIYFFEEPVLKTKKIKPSSSKPKSDDKETKISKEKTKGVASILFKYEDGPHDCEAMGVDPQTLKIYLVTKTHNQQEETKVYELPSLESKRTKKQETAKAIAVLKIPTVTGMCISNDGTRAVICTYGNAFEYKKNTNETWQDAFTKEPRTIVLPARKQGESICYGPDGKTLYLTSEAPNKGKDGDSSFFIVPEILKK